MTRLRSVDMNALGRPSRVCAQNQRWWTPPARYAKHAAVVTELYSLHLARGAPVPAETWWVRLLPSEGIAVPQFGTVAASVSYGDGEVWGIPFDPAVFELPDAHRRRAILDQTQQHLLALAAQRNWPEQPFAEAYQACLADDLRLELLGAAKSSPDRRLRARLRYTVDGNGDGWTVVEFVDGRGELVGSSDPFDSPHEARFFGRATKSLRWYGNTSVLFEPWWGWGPDERKQRTVAAPAIGAS